MTEIDKVQLREQMIGHFSLEELRLLSHDLNVDFETLGGKGKNGKVLDLILYLERRGRLPELVASVKEKRPFLNLDAPPDAPTPPAAADKPPTGDTYITIHGNVTGSSIGGGHVQADNIAGRDVNISTEPQSRDEIVNQLRALQELIQRATVAGDLANERDGETAVADLQDAIQEAEAPEPRSQRIVRRLEDVREILNGARKTGTAVAKALPLVKLLIDAAQSLF